MPSRTALFLMALVSIAIGTAVAASFAAVGLDEPTPIEEATSASETQSEHGAVKERSETNGSAQPATTPSETSSQEAEHAPRSEEDIEPLGRPMLA